jgi:hypothetical protein
LIPKGKVAEFVGEVGKFVPQALESFPNAFAKCMNNLILPEEAAVYVPEIRKIFEDGLAEFLRLYEERQTTLYGEWEKLNLLTIKQVKKTVMEKALAEELGEFEEVILGGCDLVMNECRQLYCIAKDSGSKNFI